MCAFNYRFVPAVRLARAADRGRRARRDPPLPRRATSRSGARRPRRTGASTRPPPARARSATSARTSIDLARYLVGEIDTVSALAAHLPARAGRGRRRLRGGGRVRGRRGRHARGRRASPRGARTPSRGRSTAAGLARLRPRAPQRAAGPPARLRARRGGAGLPHRARHRGRPPLLGALVAAGPHHRLGAHLRARAPPPADRDPRRRRRGPARGDARGRLPRLRGLRRDRALGASRARARRCATAAEGRRPQGRRALVPAPARGSARPSPRSRTPRAPTRRWPTRSASAWRRGRRAGGPGARADLDVGEGAGPSPRPWGARRARQRGGRRPDDDAPDMPLEVWENVSPRRAGDPGAASMRYRGWSSAGEG